MATSDPQKELVFLMEKHELRGHYHGVYKLKKLQSYARMLAKVYDVPPVTIVARNVRGLAGEYNPNTYGIKLWPKHGKNPAVLAHEFAHHIAWVRHGHRVQDHGPTFVKYFAQCMSSLRLMPVASMRVMCKRYGVRMA
jgi:hypothetical protein